MPTDLKPSTVKTLLPTTSGTFCQRFKKLIEFPNVLFNLVSYMFTESGSFTDQFKTDVCALGCAGSGGSGGGGPDPDPSMPAPTSLSASDGSLSTSVDIAWVGVVPPGGSAGLQYKIYRSADTNTDPTAATLIATVDAPTVLYNDATVVPGTTYNFWARATNGTNTSSYSNRDSGYASVPTETLPAISDLKATQGFSINDSEPVVLEWTPPTGATKYSIYRNTVNDFDTATLIMDDYEPQDSSDHIVSETSPDQVWDCFGSIVAFHFPPSPTVKYFFFVVAKKDSPPATSPESNAAQGWLRTFYAPYTGASPFILSRGESATEGVDWTGVNIRVVLVGGAAGGAGAGEVYGSGAGGGGGVVVEEFVLTASDVISVEAAPNTDNTGNAAAYNDGVIGSTMTFKINAVTKMTAVGGGEGAYSAIGGGGGGTGGGGSGTTAPTIYTGKAGRDGSGAAGGASGYHFGSKRFPGAHFNGFSGGDYDGNGSAPGSAGGGSYAAPGTPVLAVGGYGQAGYAIVSWGV